jgi:MFS family permease
VVLLQALSVEPVTWAATRFIFGACMAGLYVVVESWLNDMATNETRGRVLSVYMIVGTGGIGLGQLMLNVEDESGFKLFIIVSVLVSLSLVPVTLSASSAPQLAFPEPVRLRDLVRQVPTGVLSSFLSGASAGALLGIAPVFGSAVGMSTGRLSVFLVIPMLGGLVFQWPVGWLSDHFPRRGVMFVVALVGALAPLVALMVRSTSVVTIFAMFAVGGAMFPFYSLTVAYTNDWIQPSERVGASATLIRVNGTGAITGPILAAALMAAGGPRMFFWLLTAVFGLAATHILYRILSRPPLPFDRQTPQVAFPARATAMAASLLPRRVRNGKARGTP